MTGADEKNPQDASPPPQLLNQAEAAAAGNIQAEHASRHYEQVTANQDPQRQNCSGPISNADPDLQPGVENVPPPPYNGEGYGQLDLSQMGLDTGAKVGQDGRVNIKIKQRNRTLTNLLVPALRNQLDIHKQETPSELPSFVPTGLDHGVEELPAPPLNVVIQIVGSRGDVQPFIALGQVLQKSYGHRVRVATHPVFRDFVTGSGLEFFSIGGDPAELMAFMVKNPGLMPGFDAMRNGDIGKRRKGIYEMINGCWRSCIEPGDGTGPGASDNLLDGGGFNSGMSVGSDPSSGSFVADAIVANPPSFAHMHIAEKLGIPLHLMFTMPWSPTQAFPHPLANIQSTDCDASMTNFLTYALIDMMTWQGLGDLINRFREKTLNLDPVSIIWAPGMASRLRIPYTYCWSPALIPKPRDWGSHIDISGFYFLNLASDYTPPEDLARFLAAGPPPVYIGFGSIVVDDPNAMTKMIFEAVKKTGRRAIVSKGWGGIGADQLGIPEEVYMLGNCPHDWLFKQVSCVVHHGGAGTSAAGISSGRPTVVVPFFGDQPFWGAMIARAGAGPAPIPYKDLTADKLAAAIEAALRPESLERATELSNKIKQEKGSEDGAKSFHRQLQINSLRCNLYPKLPAAWRVRHTDIHISALAATVLGNEGLLDFSDLKLFRAREYLTDDGPWEPFTGVTAALIGTISTMMMGIADFPIEMLKALRIAQSEWKEKKDSNSSVPPSPDSRSSKSPTCERPETMVTTAEQVAHSRVSQDGSEPASVGGKPSNTAHGPDLGQNLRPSTATDSRRSSRSRSPAQKTSNAASQVSFESMIDGSKGVSRIVSAGIKSPMDFTMALAKGFHNAPKLYGDETVRKAERITGLQSGLKAVGKEFHYGFYDGITGLVTQPLKGAEKEGASGFFKGAAKGIGGLILKPAAGIWGIPGYAAKGVYAELQKHFGSSVQNFIIAARTAQGYQEWTASTTEQRTTIINAWESRQNELRKTERWSDSVANPRRDSQQQGGSTSGDWLSNFKRSRNLPFDERKKLAAEKERQNKSKRVRHGKNKVSCKNCPLQHDEGVECPFKASANSSTAKQDDEFEEAIKRSVTATSKGDPEEDATIERALRASVNELRNARAREEEDESYQRVIAAGAAEASGVNHTAELQDTELSEAMQRSLNDSARQQQGEGSYTLTSSDSERQTSGDKTPNVSTVDADNDSVTAAAADDDNGDDLQRALAESEKEHRSKQDESSREKTEEEIVLEYVKKQSLLEEQHRKQREQQQEQQ